MWREKLIELKSASGMKTKQIAEKAKMSEKTVARILSGETDRPYMDNLYDIVSALGGSLDDLFSEGSRAQLASVELIAVQNEVDRLTAEKATLTKETTDLKAKVCELTAEIDRLRLTLEHKEEIIKHKMDIIDVYDHFVGPISKSKNP